MADIHIGAMDYDQTYREYTHLRSLLKEYTKDELFDFIVIGGDFFDKQLYTSDPFIDLAQRLMIQLLSATKILRVVYGTASHESKQYSLFDPLTNELPKQLDMLNFDFKVITTVTEEELLPGLQVLYIPEEYIYDKNTYYKPYLSNKDKYNFIFGHGMIQDAFRGKIKEPKKEKVLRKKAPMFTAGELAYACSGDVLFGHYHVHTEMDENVSYVGSLSRWIQGEEEEKGFYLIEFDPDTNTTKKQFIINTEALLYATISFGYTDNVFDESHWEETAQKILKTRLKKNIHRLRVIFNLPVGYENPEAFISFFRERFKNDEHIRVEFANGYVENRIKSANERISELPDEYKVFIDKNVPEEIKISEFLRLKRGVEIPPEEIKEYLESYNAVADIIAMIEKKLDAETSNAG